MTHPQRQSTPKSASVAFRELRAALVAGDVDLAKECYVVVEQHAPSATGLPDALSAAFEELGHVLAAGDLGKAQVAFEFLQSFIDETTANQKSQPPGPVGSAGERRKVNIVG